MQGVNFALDGDMQLVTGYQNGELEVRSQKTGDIVHTQQMSTPISKIMYCDYRLEGKPQVVVCTAGGEVKGFSLASEDQAMQMAVGDEQEKQTAALAKEIEPLRKKLEAPTKQSKKEDEET